MKQRLSLLFALTALVAVLLTGCSVLDQATAVVPTLLPTAQAIIQETSNEVQTEATAAAQTDPAATTEAPFVEAEDAAGEAQVVQPEPVAPTTQETLFIDLYARVNPGVVSVNLQTGNGSGFVIDAEGYIVTNNHVIEAGGPIVIGFANGDRREAEIIGSDALADIALLKVEAQPGELTVLPLGDSDVLQVGQLVVAIGSPFGLDNTMTTGIVSGLSRSLGSGFTNGPQYQTPSIIQTDAAINPGNSGGPLINLTGEVIGVNTAIESLSGSNSGVGFSVPSNVVKVVVTQLRDSGEVRYPWLGISGGTLTSDMAEEMGLPSETRGVIVSDVTGGGPADAAGLQGGNLETGLGGDVITGIDGLTVVEFDDLLGYIVQRATIGQTVTLTILRDGQPQTVSLTLGERPTEVEQPQIETLPGGQLP